MVSSHITASSLLAKRETKIIIIGLLILVLWVLSGVIFDSSDSANTQDDQTVYVPEVKITPSIAEAFVRELTLSAITESPRLVEITTQTSGIIDKIIAKEGAAIFAGETIATLHADSREERISASSAEVEQRKLEYNAAKKLAKSGYKAKTALAEAYYRLKQAEANLKEAQLEAGYSVIQSPFTGFLNRIYLNEGDKVKSLETAVAQVMDLQPMLAVGYVPEKWRRQITEGSSASVKLNNDELVYGVVEYVSHKSEEATRTFRVEIAIDNKNGLIPAGMTAEIYIPVGNIKAHLIPSSALSLSDDGRIQIKYVDDANIVQSNFVEIAGEDAKGLWITGLPEHINLITFGQAFVQAGDKVNTDSKE